MARLRHVLARLHVFRFFPGEIFRRSPNLAAIHLMPMPRISLLSLAFAVAVTSLPAAEPAAPTAPSPSPAAITPESVQPALTKIAEATATGDIKTLRALVAAETSAPSGPAFAAYHLALTRACLDLNLFPRALQHFRAAGAPREFAWLAGIAYCNQRDWPRADQVILAYKNEKDASYLPRFHFLNALRAFIQWTDLPAGDPLTEKLLREADDSSSSFDRPESADRPGFDPRFRRLRVFIAEATQRPDALSAAIRARSHAFPRHVAFKRAALADFLTSTYNREALQEHLGTVTLPADEPAVWRRVYSTPMRADLPFLSAFPALAARELPQDPDYAPSRLILLREALRDLSESVRRWHRPDGTFARTAEEVAHFYKGYGRDLVAFTREFARLALSEASRADAETALRWIDFHRLNPAIPRADWIELETDLAVLTHNHPRALRLILDQVPAHASDVPWHTRYADFMAKYAPLADSLVYLRRLEKLLPDEPRVPLALAGLATRVTTSRDIPDRTAARRAKIASADPTAPDDNPLTSSEVCREYYARVFAQVPQRLVPDSRSWDAYRDLLVEQQSSLDFAHTGKTAPAAPSTPAFDQLVERIHAVAARSGIVSGQYALLLTRRAEAQPTAENLKTARAALARADELGAPVPDLRRAYDRLNAKQKAADEAAYIARLEAQDRANQAKTQQILASRPAPSSQNTSPISSPRSAQDPAKRRAQFATRTTYVRSLPQKIASYTRDVGFYGASTILGKNARATADALTAEQKNFCETCKGVGAFSRGSGNSQSIEACFPCSGTGKKDRRGPGGSAGF